MYSLVPTTQEHIEELATTMRQVDRDEVWAANHSTPLRALTNGVSLTEEPFTGLVDGKVVCIFGVSTMSFLSEDGTPWLLGSDLIEENKHVFLRMNRVYTREIKKRYKSLSNYIDVRNTKTLVWLKWLGFTIHDPAPHGPDNMLFRKFEFRRK